MINISLPSNFNFQVIVISGLMILASPDGVAFAPDLRVERSVNERIWVNENCIQDTIRHVQIKISAKELPVGRDSAIASNPADYFAAKQTKSRQQATPVNLQVRKEFSYPSKSALSATLSSQVIKPKTHTLPNSSANTHPKVSQNTVEIAADKDSFHAVVYNCMVTSVILLLCGLGFLAWLYKRKSRSHNELAAQNEEIKNETAIIANQSKSLAELNELKDKLFAIVSHDLRSPIGNLRAIMEMFQTEGMSVEEIGEILTEMVPSVENADMIISNLLNWAVNQRDGLKLNKSTVFYRNAIDDTVRSFTYLLSTKKITVENTISDNVVVFADIDQVKIILRNFVSNAVKFVPIGGRIKFYSHEHNEEVVLAVEDNGKGLTDEEIANLFTNKTHFTKNGTKGEKGAGIGLMLCKEMACLNDGKICVDSVPGESCTFYLRLPKSEVAEPVF